MSGPVLDARRVDDLRREVGALAGSYTPEWRLDSAQDDPGAALAELFCTMFGQTVDRLNAVPSKLYIEFLDQVGFREPPPVPAKGTMVFSPSDTVEEPVHVPAGTQVFSPDSAGENIVYETQWSIQATPARLTGVFFADGDRDEIRRLDLSKPMPFFTLSGEALQRHRLELGQEQALRLDCPAEISIEFLDAAGRPVPGLAEALAERRQTWAYRHGGAELPFDAARAESGALVLEKRNSLSLEADETGDFCVSCQGTPTQAMRLEQVLIRTAPLAPVAAQGLFSGDVPIRAEEGGYCFGRRPAPYSLFYLRSDTVLTKRGARAALTLDISPVTVEPERDGPVIRYDRHIIDKQGAVETKPDDAWVSGVLWEYFNGSGWRRLEVTGDKNPFSCRREGTLNTVFVVPDDLEPTEVNAETGYYIRVRVTEVENQFSQYQRWILPFIKGAAFQWQYERGVRADRVCAENHGRRTEVLGADRYEHLSLAAMEPMTPGEQCMYFQFDRSPHALPLSIRFQIAGGKETEDSLQWEWWNGKRFAPVHCVDQTGRLGRSGEIQIFLGDPIPQAGFFGETGHWLRLSRTSSRPGPAPVVGEIRLNAVTAVQYQREPEQYFDTGVYDAGKTLQLMNAPVQRCQVWVDEKLSLSAGEPERMKRERPDQVELVWADHELERCWVRWSIIDDLALAAEDQRVCALDPYTGIIRFGDGRHGRVPPQGTGSIRVSCSSGGGERGNLPPGEVNALLGGLPLIADVTNITPMSGGTGRIQRERIETQGNRILRTRGRAAARRDYEDLVLQAFPQVRHIRCFPGTDQNGKRAPGHVTVVLSAFGSGDGSGELCAEVLSYLGARCSCCLTAEKRLHVCPATVLTVNTQTVITVKRPELAADTQQEIARALAMLIERRWKARPIGGQLRLDEMWQTVRQTPNVETIHRIMAEGACREDGVDRLYPLEEDERFPFCIVENGIHQVRIQ